MNCIERFSKGARLNKQMRGFDPYWDLRGFGESPNWHMGNGRSLHHLMPSKFFTGYVCPLQPISACFPESNRPEAAIYARLEILGDSSVRFGSNGTERALKPSDRSQALTNSNRLILASCSSYARPRASGCRRKF